MTAKGWTSDAIIGRAEIPISCSVRTLYRLFKANDFAITKLPMKGNHKPNGHNERCGKQVFKRNIAERLTDYTHFNEEFGHLVGDTLVDVHHKSAVITLVKRF